MADERESLERQAARAAWTMVDRAEAAGEVHETVRWARRALEIVPEDEDGVRRLIRLQDARGDRAGAVRTYEEFAARLEVDLDVPPSEETQALIAAIRNREDGAHPGEDLAADETAAMAARSADSAAEEGDSSADERFRRSPRRHGAWVAAAAAFVLVAGWLVFPRSEGGSSATMADGPAVVAVLPFEVRGEGLDVWREGMVDVLSTNFDVFPEFRAISSRTLLARWRGVERGGLTDQAAVLEVARETGAEYAITGSVMDTEQGLFIRGQLFDVQTGTRIGGTRVEGPADSIFALVDRLSVALMEPLLDTDVQDRRWPRLKSVTTSSPEALKSFLEGERFFRAGEYKQAIEEFHRAIEADSTFALVYSRLYDAYLWTPGNPDTNVFVYRALRYADRLTEREARLVRAKSALSGRLSSKALEILREAVYLHPDDSEAWYWLGEAYFHAGGPLLIPPWKFIDAFERSVELDPSLASAYEHLIEAAFLRRPDPSRVQSVIEKAVLSDAGRAYHKAAFRLAFGDPLTRSETRSLLRDIPADSRRRIATNALTHPRFLDRREMVLRIALENSDPSYERVIRSYLFWTLVARGHIDAAIQTSRHHVLDPNRVTLLFQARAMGYPIPEAILARALEDAPTRTKDRESALLVDRGHIPGIFERGARAAETGDWAAHAAAKRDLRSRIPKIESQNASDTLRVWGLIRALDGYAAWQRGDHARGLDLLETARVQTAPDGPSSYYRSIMAERNRIVGAWLGELLLEMDRPRDALVYFESLGPGWPLSQDPMMYFRMGQIRNRLGNREGAHEAYELAALAWRDPDPAMEAFAETARREATRLGALVRN